MNKTLNDIINHLNERKFLILGILVGLVVYLLLLQVPETELSEGGKRIIALSAMCTVFFPGPGC